MISISKSSNIPSILTSRGVSETSNNNSLYDSSPADYIAGKKKIKIHSKIYGDKLVKQQLQSEQFEKCCFCEAKFTANGYGDVEHFRPKAGYKQILSQKKLFKPGYYWLAYDWDNLLFSCQICNQKFKKNYFPLINNANRANSHNDNLANEEPVLINPCLINPEKHITFRKHVPRGLDLFGKESIKAFGIGRKELNEVREKHFNDVENNIMLAAADLRKFTQSDKDNYSKVFNLPWPKIEELIKKAKKFVKVAAKPKSPFAAMVRANYPHLPQS